MRGWGYLELGLARFVFVCRDGRGIGDLIQEANGTGRQKTVPADKSVLNSVLLGIPFVMRYVCTAR